MDFDLSISHFPVSTSPYLKCFILIYLVFWLFSLSLPNELSNHIIGNGTFYMFVLMVIFFHISGIFVGCICASNFLNGRKTFLLFKFLFSCLITLKENNLTVLFCSYI